MSAEKRPLYLTVLVIAAIVALVAGFFVSQHLHGKKHVDVSQFHGTYLENPREINAFSLVGIDQKPFTNSNLRGHWTLIFFGFTNCGYLCPTTMTELAKMYHQLEEKGVKDLPEVVMISIDPDRDSLEKLANYVKAFDPHFYGARGEDKAIAKMTKEMGIAYYKVAGKAGSDPKDYDMQHSGAVMLFNPEGQLNAFFTTPHEGELLAKDYLSLVS